MTTSGQQGDIFADQKPPNILKEGLVTKQGGRIKTWKKRWCVLNETGLFYYKLVSQQPASATLRYQNLQGQIEIEAIEVAECVQEKDKVKKKHCFKIVTPGRTFLIAAESEEEMESWLAIIKQVKEGAPISRSSFLPHIPRGPVEVEIHTKSAEELEEVLHGLEEAMRMDINSFVNHCLKEKDNILDQLMQREIEEVEKKFNAQQSEMESELQLRESSS